MSDDCLTPAKDPCRLRPLRILKLIFQFFTVFFFFLINSRYVFFFLILAADNLKVGFTFVNTDILYTSANFFLVFLVSHHETLRKPQRLIVANFLFLLETTIWWSHRQLEKKVKLRVLLTSFPYGVLLVVTSQKIYSDAIEMFPYCTDCNLQYTGVSLLCDAFHFFIVQWAQILSIKLTFPWQRRWRFAADDTS